jgi:purine nucleosidase
MVLDTDTYNEIDDQFALVHAVLSRVLFDSGVALVHVPCLSVADHLTTTRDEVEHYVRPAGKVGALLAERFEEYVEDRPGVSKVIWDLAATAWLLDESRTTSVVTHSPVLTQDMTWSLDARRHLISEVTLCPEGRNIHGFVRLLGPACDDQ